MSYLLFDAAYTRTLVEIGYADAQRRSAEIEALIREAPPLAVSGGTRRSDHAPRMDVAHAAPTWLG